METHTPVIWSVINRMTGDRDLAEDLYQETVIRFWKGLPAFKGESRLTTWLYTIAYRVCLDALTREKRDQQNQRLDDSAEEGGGELPDESRRGGRIENDVAARDAVQNALAVLPPEWKAMLTFHYWQGLSIEEIAEITGRPENTVKVYLHRARRKLREVLENRGYPPED